MTTIDPLTTTNPTIWGFMVRLIWGRWFMMFGSLLIMGGAGGTYLFGIYSQQIKTTMGYNQSTLNLLGTFKDLGANVGVLSGLIAEITPIWLVLSIGSIMNFVGYFMIWLSLTEKVPKAKVWQMCIYICLGANSQNFANTGSLVTCVKNFPQSRGMMVGLLKGYVGLSGAVFTQLYHAIYGEDAKSLVLLIAWLPASISLLFVFTMRIIKLSTNHRHPREVTVFYHYLYISIGLALTAMTLTIAQKGLHFSHLAYILSATLICLWLCLPLAVAINEEYKDLKDTPKIEGVIVEPNKEQGMKEERGDKMDPTCFMNICDKPPRGQDYTILQALLSVDMIILFMATLCGLGCSLTAVDNMGQIGLALGYPTKTISSSVSLISIWNYFGRVFAGFGSEILLAQYKVPRPLMMSVALFLSSVGDLLIAFPFKGSVYLASLLIGFTFGAQLTLLFTIISELFGLKYYSTLFNCGQLASPLGSYILNVHVVGRLYDLEAKRQLALKDVAKSVTNDLSCIGNQCFRLSFIILASVNIFGGLILLVLVVRTRKFYKGDIYRKFKDQSSENKIEMGVASKSDTKEASVKQQR